MTFTMADDLIEVKSTPEIIEITKAPDRAKVTLSLLMTDAKRGIHFDYPDLLWLGSPQTVGYRIIGWDGAGALELEKVYDFRKLADDGGEGVNRE